MIDFFKVVHGNQSLGGRSSRSKRKDTWIISWKATGPSRLYSELDFLGKSLTADTADERQYESTTDDEACFAVGLHFSTEEANY